MNRRRIMALDDQFLTECGLGTLSSAAKEQFLAEIYDELELRVGGELSSGMSRAQLQEFDQLMSGSWVVIEEWLSHHFHDPESHPFYLRLARQKGLDSTRDEAELRVEFARIMWLDINRPDHRLVVERTFMQLKAELRAAAEQILGESP